MHCMGTLDTMHGRVWCQSGSTAERVPAPRHRVAQHREANTRVYPIALIAEFDLEAFILTIRVSAK